LVFRRGVFRSLPFFPFGLLRFFSFPFFPPFFFFLLSNGILAAKDFYIIQEDITNAIYAPSLRLHLICTQTDNHLSAPNQSPSPVYTIYSVFFELSETISVLCTPALGS